MIQSLTLIAFLIFILNFAFYEAARLERKHWIYKKEKQYSLLFRLAFLLVCSQGNVYLFLAYSFLMAGLYDFLLNHFRKDIVDNWHLGTTAKWDIFWSKYPIGYRVARCLLNVIGIAFFIYSFNHSELPFYY